MQLNLVVDIEIIFKKNSCHIFSHFMTLSMCIGFDAISDNTNTYYYTIKSLSVIKRD